MTPKITTRRLSLIQVEKSHAKELFRYWNDSEVAGLLNIHPFTCIDEVEEMIDLLNNKNYQQQVCLFTVLQKQTNTIVGSCGFHFLDSENDKAEISYEIGREHQGRGLAIEALSSLLNYGFHELRLNRIEANIISENIKSKGLLRKLGFQYEGTHRQSIKKEGSYLDTLIFSLLKNEFK